MANVGDRIRALREEKKLSEGDVEKRTGLLRCYISRVENCHTVPSIETLEKLARALELPLYRLFYDGEVPPKLPTSLRHKPGANLEWGASGKNGLYLSKLRRCLARIDERDRKLLMATAQKIASYGRDRDRGGASADVKG
jgi:transcriptional regulator with XRE-family HTH domain